MQSSLLCFSLQRRPIYDIFPPAITKEEEKEEDDTDEDDEHDRDRDGDAEEEEVDDSGKFSPSSPPVSAKVAFSFFSSPIFLTGFCQGVAACDHHQVYEGLRQGGVHDGGPVVQQGTTLQGNHRT